MVSLIIIIASFVALMLVMISPKLGANLIWLILFTYPHTFWYKHGFLPMNIGMDDLYCIALFVAVVIRKNILKGTPIRTGYAFWVITGFLFVSLIANISGFILAEEQFKVISLSIKEVLKMGIYWCLFYAILHSIDSEKDLKTQITFFLIAAVVGAVLVIVSYSHPYLMIPWRDPTATIASGSIAMKEISYHERACGAFLNPNAASCVLAFAIVFIMSLIKLQKTFILKLLTYSVVFIVFVGMLITRSRAGLLSISVVFVLMVFLSNSNRYMALLFIFAAIAVVSLSPNVSRLFMERLEDSYSGETGMLGSNVVSRFSMWTKYFESASFYIYLFGQGKIQGELRNGMSSTHSAYVAIITTYGFGGMIWAIASLTNFIKREIVIIRDDNPYTVVVGKTCFWAIIIWGVYAMFADAIGSQYTRYLLFFLVVLMDRAYTFSTCHNNFADENLYFFEETVY